MIDEEKIVTAAVEAGPRLRRGAGAGDVDPQPFAVPRHKAQIEGAVIDDEGSEAPCARAPWPGGT